MGRRERERRTIRVMIAGFCREHHRPPRGKLCETCQDLLNYAEARLEKCPYGLAKPTCANCTTHCYRPVMREQIRQVMRYSGPRMLPRHPWLAIMHLLDHLRSKRESRETGE